MFEWAMRGFYALLGSMKTSFGMALGLLFVSAVLVYLVFAFVRFDWTWPATVGEWGRILAAISWLVVAGALRKMMSVVGR